MDKTNCCFKDFTTTLWLGGSKEVSFSTSVGRSSNCEPIELVSWRNLSREDWRMETPISHGLEKEIPSLKLTARIWKWMVGRLFSGEAYFQEGGSIPFRKHHLGFVLSLSTCWYVNNYPNSGYCGLIIILRPSISHVLGSKPAWLPYDIIQ